MRAIPATRPRRRPRQARAQATVDAIIKATAQVLVQEGYDRASTNRIAQAAGVSIGSLYQYFPSKEALVAALVEAHHEKMMGVLNRAIEDVTPAGLPHNARVMVDGLIRAYRVDPKLYHVLCQEVPKVGELRKVYEFEERLADASRSYLRGLRQSIRHADVDRAIFLLVNAVPGVIRAAVQADPEGREDDKLASDLTDLVLRYLMVDPPNAGAAGVTHQASPPGVAHQASTAGLTHQASAAQSG